MESIAPAETRKPKRGFPNTLKASTDETSGCGIIPTLYPCDSKSLPKRAAANDG